MACAAKSRRPIPTTTIPTVASARSINPTIPSHAVENALEKLLDRRQAMTLVAANQDVYNLVRDGIPVEFDDSNRAYDKFLHRQELQGKLGVFWHTQGSGKSFSMIFYVRKIFRKLTSMPWRCAS